MRRHLGWAAVVLLACALASVAVFQLLGSEVDRGGILREPFFLIPLAWLCLFAGSVAGTVYLALGLRRRPGAESELKDGAAQ